MAVSEFGLRLSAETVGEAKLQEFANKLDSVTKKLVEADEKAGKSSGFDKFAAGVKDAVQNPLQAAGNAAESFLTKLGPVGAGVTATVAVVAALGTASLSAARDLGQYGDQLGDTALRLGVTAKEAYELSLAMKMAGGDVSQVEAAMRILSRGLSSATSEGKDARETLASLGVTARNSDGSLRPITEVLVEISRGLAGMTDTADRNTAAIKLFGRAGMEVLPDILELSEGLKRAKAAGLAPTDEDVKRWSEYQAQIAEVDAVWEKLKRDMKEPLAAIMSVTIKWLASGDGTNASVGARGMGGRTYSGLASQQTQEEALLLANGITPLSFGNKLGGPGADFIAQIQGATAADISKHASNTQHIKALRAAFGATKDGIQEALSQAKKDLQEARDALFAGDISKEKDVNARSADVSRLTAQMAVIAASEKASQEAQKAAAALADLAAKGWAGINYRQMLGGIGGTDAVGTAGVKPLEIESDLQFQSQNFLKYRQAWAKEDQDAETEAQKILKADSQIREQSQKAELDHRMRMVELLSGPGGEIAAIEKIYQLRMAGAKNELEAQDAIYQRQEQLLALHKQQVDQYVSLVQGATNALLSGGGGLRSFIKGQGMGMVSQIAGNVTRLGYDKIPEWLHATEGSTAAKLLAGTPFGADPLKASTDANTMATVQNTMALRSVAMSASGGGGGLVTSGLAAMRGPLGSWGDNTSPGTGIPGELDELNSLNAVGKGGMTWGKGLGMAGAAAGGAFGVYSGIKQGGGRGAMTAAGSALAATGAIMQLASKALAWAGPVGMIAGMGLGLATSLFGDPKKKEAERIGSFMDSHRYAGPENVSSTIDMYGRGIGYDMKGNMRPIIIHQTNHIQALDTANFGEYLDKHADTLNRGMAKAIDRGGDFIPKLQKEVGLA
jgi:hypothetical protein